MQCEVCVNGMHCLAFIKCPKSLVNTADGCRHGKSRVTTGGSSLTFGDDRIGDLNQLIVKQNLFQLRQNFVETIACDQRKLKFYKFLLWINR